MDFSHSFARVDYRIEILDLHPVHQRVLRDVLVEVATVETHALSELRDWLVGILEEEEIEPPPTKPGREVVDQKRAGAKLYQLEMVRCGKGSCKSCPHGPYWYGYRRAGGKLKSWYIGKDLSKEFSVPVEQDQAASVGHQALAAAADAAGL
ncbi:MULTISPECIES: hypothetical protein [Cyanophyceae]|uniref:hypothetical protein n=1 Tax=Cyanophyceae TaxID=3028117 RepID=UPI001689E5B3|nr:MULTISPECIES: hypothetical protein [Cyanophyceae]MBD1917427.1 hypothetical protein [Phormidium sp. FACHB-77]MBD2032328.1 hypothetical protein [Phormidium sp. FACHB-322]MBD2052266.1 hypothetical protein [Leptolyngbya sp. FACHB-60]